MGARRFGEKYHVADSYRIATNETGEILDASEVWQLYIDEVTGDANLALFSAE